MSLSASTATTAPNALPHDLETEQALLGAILVNNQALLNVSLIIDATHFFDPLHQRIYAACLKLIDSGRVASAASLKEHFNLDSAMQEVGGSQYLIEIMRFSPTVINAADYARLIRDMADRRKIIGMAQNLIATAQDPPVDQNAAQLLTHAEAAIAKLGVDEQRVTIVRAADAATSVVEDLDYAMANPGLIGVPFGLACVDDECGGFRDHNLIVFGARPGAGKSIVGSQIAFNAARAGMGVVYFSLEMSAKELTLREISNACHRAGTEVPYRDIQRAKISNEQAEAVYLARSTISDLPIVIDERGGIDGDYVASQLKRHARIMRTQGTTLRLAVIDHLHLMKLESVQYATQSYGAITARLKQAAKDSGIPIILLAQLNRENEKRWNQKLSEIYNTRPQLSDLRQSGSIEQDADVIGMLFRAEQLGDKLKPNRMAFDTEEKYLDEYNEWVKVMNRLRNKMDIYFDKQRMGPASHITLKCFVGSNALRDPSGEQTQWHV
jgi:replicative DNA helicase